jgi:hypothetical protein
VAFLAAAPPASATDKAVTAATLLYITLLGIVFNRYAIKGGVIELIE